MNLAQILQQAPAADYAQAVDFILERRYSMSIATLDAGNIVAAGRRAGYSSSECVDWLAEIDGLE